MEAWIAEVSTSLASLQHNSGQNLPSWPCHADPRPKTGLQYAFAPLYDMSLSPNPAPNHAAKPKVRLTNLSSNMFADLMSRWKAFGLELCMCERPFQMAIGVNLVAACCICLPSLSLRSDQAKCPPAAASRQTLKRSNLSS